jgi:hypothetical protein
MFQRKSQFEEPNSYDMTKTTTCWTGSTGAIGGPQPESTINTAGGWVRPTRAGWALPPDEPLGNDGSEGMGQMMAKSRARPVSAGLSDGKSNVITSREAVKKYGGQFIYR